MLHDGLLKSGDSKMLKRALKNEMGCDFPDKKRNRQLKIHNLPLEKLPAY